MVEITFEDTGGGRIIEKGILDSVRASHIQSNKTEQKEC